MQEVLTRCLSLLMMEEAAVVTTTLIVTSDEMVTEDVELLPPGRGSEVPSPCIVSSHSGFPESPLPDP